MIANANSDMNSYKVERVELQAANTRRKKKEDINSFFNVRSNKSISSTQQSYLNQKNCGVGLGSMSQNETGSLVVKVTKDPLLQKHNAAMLSAGRSVVPTHIGANTNINQLFNERPSLPPTKQHGQPTGAKSGQMDGQMQQKSHKTSTSDFLGTSDSRVQI